jgi:hypothetical protein
LASGLRIADRAELSRWPIAIISATYREPAVEKRLAWSRTWVVFQPG